jgi:serine/threonine-protein kinase
MKPSNVMLKPDGAVKLIDFGTAKEYIVENNADTTALGTRGYAAPEQFGDAQGRGIYNTDARTDIYNLGATLYHLVTGKNPCEPPYEIKPIRQWNPALSSGFEQIIVKCCQANPNDRYQSCSELLYALDHYNELDNEYKAKSKKKVITFGSMVALSLLSIGCSAFGFSKSKQLKEQNYNNQIIEAENAHSAGDEQAAIDYYKAAINLDTKQSEAYLGLLDEYTYYYDTAMAEDSKSDTAESGAEIGVRYVLKYIDDVEDDVIYRVASIYYDELQEYKLARQYFAMVDDDSFSDEVIQAGYYKAICDNKIDKNANFTDESVSLYEFEEYNESEIDGDNTNKYVNYLNIANIYVDNLDADAQMPQRTIDLLSNANDELDKNTTALSNAFPVDKGVKYYTGQYAIDLNEVYQYLAEQTEDTSDKQNYYLAAIDALNRYIVAVDVNADGVTDTIIGQYSTYMVVEAETYVNLGNLTGDTGYYDKAEETYRTAEDALGENPYAAEVYISHLNYLYDRYSVVYGLDPNNWEIEGGVKVQVTYKNGMQLESLSNLDNNRWNSLINNSAISGVIQKDYGLSSN